MARVLHGSAIGRGRRIGAWALFAVASIAYLSLMPAPGARAQEPKEAAKAEPAPADAKEAPAAAPAADAGAPAAPEPSKKAQRNLLQWAIDASGPIGLFLLCLSVYFVALIIKLFLELRVSEAVPVELVEKLEAAIKDKKFQEAYDACKDNDSFLARLVRTGVANLPNGRAEAKEAMANVQDEVVTLMETRISYLAIIGTLGPMIGLVGTIAGMIASFQEIANAVGAQPRPDKVAEGISTALFITLEGVSLSVPAIFFFAYFRNRIAKITLETAKVADRTITSLLNAAKQAKTA